VTPQQADLGGDPDHYETNSRYDMPWRSGLSGGVRYWIVAQAADIHSLGSGADGAVDRQGCVSTSAALLRTEEWTPPRTPSGVLHGRIDELSGYCGGVAIRRSTWGAIRGLYR